MSTSPHEDTDGRQMKTEAKNKIKFHKNILGRNNKQNKQTNKQTNNSNNNNNETHENTKTTKARMDYLSVTYASLCVHNIIVKPWKTAISKSAHDPHNA